MNIVTKTMAIVAVVATTFFPAVVMAEAPTPTTSHCWSKDIAMGPLNDPQLRVAIVGRVAAIDYNQRQLMNAGTRLRLKSDDGQEKSVYVGLPLSQMSIRVGDRLDVQGVKVNGPKKSTTILAATVKKGDRTWQIRQQNNKPTWVKWCK